MSSGYKDWCEHEEVVHFAIKNKIWSNWGGEKFARFWRLPMIMPSKLSQMGQIGKILWWHLQHNELQKKTTCISVYACIQDIFAKFGGCLRCNLKASSKSQANDDTVATCPPWNLAVKTTYKGPPSHTKCFRLSVDCWEGKKIFLQSSILLWIAQPG